MSNFTVFLDSLPDYAKDIKLNAKSVIVNPVNGLTKKQVAICAISSAVTTKSRFLINLLEEHFAIDLSEVEISAARGCAAIMGMNNIYYRFLHLCSNHDYQSMQPGLRMTIIANSGIDSKDFELAALSASAITGCGMCIDSHEKKLKAEGITSDAIQHAIKIASILHALTCISSD